MKLFKAISIFPFFFLIAFAKTANDQTTAEIVEQVSSAVVVIVAESPYEDNRGQGSGVIIGDGSTVVTNVHVVAGASSVTVHLQDKRTVKSSGYIKADNDRDLVTIQLPEKLSGIPKIKLASFEKMKIGEKVVAIGSPQGLANTVSEGIISGIREFESGTKVIQTSAPVSPGSSGGGLFNGNGELIGITSFGHTKGQNLNFAYPADYILPLMVSISTSQFITMKSQTGIVANERTVYVTRTGKKYHRLTCRYVRKSIIPIDLSDALERGYAPCKVCKPR